MGFDVIEQAVASVSDPADDDQRITAVRAVSPAEVDEVMVARADRSAVRGALLATGTGVSPGVGLGVVCRDSAAALDAAERGADVVLFVDETGPADEPVMRIAAAVVTRRGGMASHAAIVARQWGLPAVCGVGDVDLADGVTVLVDGSSGEVRADAGERRCPPLEVLPDTLVTLLDWADAIARPRVVVMANADLVDDVRRAIGWGAAGVGLCRTEHQFLGAASEILRRLLGGGSTDAFVEHQREAVGAVVGAVDGRPVRVRLLDAPTHEFGVPDAERNPMMGVRGARMAIVAEPVLRAQVVAIAHGVADAAGSPDAGGSPDAAGAPAVSITVPMVSMAAEIEAIREVIDDEVARVAAAREVALRIGVGVMVETPRATLVAGELARSAEFFSFGTNDLTQLTYGLSRDDVDSALADYVERGIVARSPFESLDGSGVARLMALAVETGRAVDPALRMSMCGEHAADPASIAVALRLGIDELSVSPFRVPATRLAAAHAVLDMGA